MMDKMKLDGTVNESSVEQCIHKCDVIVHIMWKSEALHLAEPGIMAGTLDGWQNFGEVLKL